MATRSVEHDLEVIAALRAPTRRRLYEYVDRQPSAVSRDEVAGAVGVSRALAVFHLDKLVELGLLKAEYRRLSGRSGPGAGRTSKLYRRSKHRFTVSLPHRDPELLARLLVQDLPADQEVAAVPAAREYGRSLGTRVRRSIRGRPTQQRLLACVEAALESLQFDPYRAAPAEVRLRTCPFEPLSRLFTPVVCSIGQAIVTGVVEGVGADQLRVGRQEQRDRCCSVVGSPAVISNLQAGPEPSEVAAVKRGRSRVARA